MTSVEQLLRDALHARVRDVRAAPDAWQRIANRAVPPRGPRPARGGVLIALGAAGAALVLIAAVAALGEDESRPVAVGPSSTMGEVEPAPTELFAVTQRGDIVALDARTGARLRTVLAADRRPTGVPAPATLAVSPNHETLFFGTDGAGCGGGVYEVSTAEGSESVLVAPDASSPTISPDDRLLAFVAGTDELNCTLVVIDRMSGERRQFAYPPVHAGESATSATRHGDAVACSLPATDAARRPVLTANPRSPSLAWAPDSRHLAFGFQTGRGPLRGPEQVYGVGVLDTALHEGLAEAAIVGPPLKDTVTTSGWWNPTWTDDLTLWVVSSERCGPPGSPPPGRRQSFDQTGFRTDPALEILRIDVTTGGATAVESFDDPTAAPFPLVASHAGHLLWSTFNGDIFTYRLGGVVEVARGSGPVGGDGRYLAATW